jgi:hypothetical protein
MAINVNIELTDLCNLRCRMCSQAAKPGAHGATGFMDWDTWRRALEALYGMPGRVELCPHWLGEPTLHPDFDRMLELAFSLNAGNRLFRSFKLHTNAVLLGPARSRRLLRLAALPSQASDTFAAIHFSLDAACRTTYRILKGADAFETVEANVRSFLDLRRRLGARRPLAQLAFVVQEENAGEAAAFVDRWLPLLGDGRAVTGDWPGEHDAIYLRPLNCADQEAAARPHAWTCDALGVELGRKRAAGSF